MFEVAELGHKISKKEYQEKLPELRYGLLMAQHALKEADFPVIILVTGVDGAGKGHTINLLNEWMDTRYIRSFSFGDLSDEERERPEYWRYWRSLPAPVPRSSHRPGSAFPGRGLPGRRPSAARRHRRRRAGPLRIPPRKTPGHS